MFAWIRRMITSIFGKSTLDESHNVIDSMVKAKSLYKELIIKAHPDRNRGNEELAKIITEEINNSRYNYRELLNLEKRIKEELLK